MKIEQQPAHNSSIGKNSAAIISLLVYILPMVLNFVPYVKFVAWLVPLIVFVIEDDSMFVKFHAMQAFLLRLVVVATSIILSILGVFGALNNIAKSDVVGAVQNMSLYGVIIIIIAIVYIVLTIICAIFALMYKELHLPLLGNLAEQLAYK